MQNLEHIRMLVLSADLGSFSACARHLGKVQSAVSHGISTLEIDLNVELFDRSTRKPVLTPAGERLYRSAKALLAQSDEFSLIAKSINRQEESELCIVIDDALLTPKITQLLALFAEKFPHTQLDILTRPSPDIVPLIQQGKASFGLMFTELATIKEVDFCYIGHMPMLAVCHPDHPLAQRDQVNETDLFAHRQLAIRGSQKTEPPMMVSMSPNVWWCSSSLNALALIQQNVGWGYLPEYLVTPKIEAKALAQLRMSFDHVAWQVPIDLIWQRGNAIGPGAKWLFNELKQRFVTP
ncbi:HTH-type transcriptional activator AllS [Marinomonas aquimarina]|uniref:HTH-type transcriptional activator AllS n=1 Tax=Marinomonas aquimarina TaxID=295068 RepID=A0A1A8TPF4_9GAMM|nr:LysR family transcriptional regulator [Marinomonas aquimarina]SBS35196.1 HTH-type transcriptional activator AllS [Marinomonas aquimarina]